MGFEYRMENGGINIYGIPFKTGEIPLFHNSSQCKECAYFNTLKRAMEEIQYLRTKVSEYESLYSVNNQEAFLNAISSNSEC